MSVKYNVVERGNPSNREAPTKFYPSIMSSGRRTLRQLSERAAQISTVSTADLMASVESMLIVIPQELAAGNIVELGDFGSFWLKVNTSGVAVAEDVRATQIETILPRFTPGREFKKTLSTIQFEKA